MIKPTVGRIVLYFSHVGHVALNQPWPAIISQVHSDTCVNLAIFRANGSPVEKSQETSEVPTAAPGDAAGSTAKPGEDRSTVKESPAAPPEQASADTATATDGVAAAEGK